MVVVCLSDQSWIDLVGPIEDTEFVAWDLTGDPPQPDRVELLVPPYQTYGHGMERLGEVTKLRHLQLLSAGYDHALAHLPPGVALHNAAGVHDAATAELAVTLTLAAQRNIPQFVHGQAAGVWVRSGFGRGLADRRVLVVGYGRIGSAIAGRLAPFEVELTAVATRPRDGDDVVPHVHGMDELFELLPHQDVVILIVPLTEATTGLVDERFLAAMKNDALLVNVARGKVVDTEALRTACGSGRIRAALDVTDPEPLPAGHPLYQTPGVLVVPHVGGATEAFFPRAAALIRAQVRALLAGDPLANQVSPG